MQALSDLGEEIARIASHIEAADYELTTKIGEFDERGGWVQQGALSCAHWLSWKIGLGLTAAREKVRVARALRGLPKTSEELKHARLSFSKVRAVTRVATPENEEALIAIAQAAPAAQVEKVCRKYRSVQTQSLPAPALPEADLPPAFTTTTLDDGRVRFTVTMPADRAARFVAAVEQASRIEQPNDDSAEASKQARPRPSRLEGLMTMVESFLADGPRTRRGGAPHEVSLHVGLDELRSKTEGGFITEPGIIGVSPETARRLCCDAGLVAVVEGADGKVLDEGRRMRTIPPSVRRAVELRDGKRCCFPGCTHQRFLEAHHNVHWADGGPSTIENTSLVCWAHHTFLHEQGWSVARDAEGVPRFTPPAETKPIPSACMLPPPPSEPLVDLAISHADRGLSIEPLGLIPHNWRGEPTDYDAIISHLCQRERSPQASPAVQLPRPIPLGPIGFDPNVRITRCADGDRDEDMELVA
jgi:hypothetical protein